MRDLSEFPSHVKSRWWYMAVQAGIALVVISLALALFGSSSDVNTTHLVLRPASSLPANEVPSAIDGLRPDGSLVQTVLHVLGSDRLLQTAATVSNVHDVSKYSIAATVQPGSAFFDQKVEGPNAKTVATLASSLNTADADYITSAYTAYSLDVVGSSSSKSHSFPPKAAVVLLALLLGALCGLATLFGDWWYRAGLRARPQPVGLSLDLAATNEDDDENDDDEESSDGDAHTGPRAANES